MKYFKHRQITSFGFHLMTRFFCAAKVTRPLSRLQQSQNFTVPINQVVPLFKKSLLYANNNCIKDFNGQYTYMQLYTNSKKLSRQISNICGSGSCSTIAYFTTNDILTVLILWASWMSGQLVMPLKYDDSFDKLSDIIIKSNTKLLITSQKYEQLGKQLALKNDMALLAIDHNFLNLCKETSGLKREVILTCTEHNQIFEGVLDNEFYNNSPALIGYSNEVSGSESILLSHHDLNHAMRKTVHSWNITHNDRILYITTLNQKFNNEFIFNLLFPLSVGSYINILEPFDAKYAWRTILGINVSLKERVNVLVSEPIVYSKMIQEFDQMFASNPKITNYIKDYCQRNIRLMLSCFESLDTKIFSRWLKITGHSLFETNFLTELKNFDSEENSLGSKFSNIRAYIVDENNLILLELDQATKERFQNPAKVIVGRLLVRNLSDKTLCSTGEIVCYSQGVLKKIGHYNFKNK